MKNPWTHSDVPEQSPSSSRGMRLLTVVVWGVLLLTVAGFAVFSSRGMVSTGSVGSLLTALSVLLVVVIAIPILRKLLAISRLLAALALLGNIWLVFRLLAFQQVDWAQALLDGNPVDALFELGSGIPELFALTSFWL